MRPLLLSTFLLIAQYFSGSCWIEEGKLVKKRSHSILTSCMLIRNTRSSLWGNRIFELWWIRNNKNLKWNKETWEEHEVPLPQPEMFSSHLKPRLSPRRLVISGSKPPLPHFQKLYHVLSYCFYQDHWMWGFTHLKSFHVWSPSASCWWIYQIHLSLGYHMVYNTQTMTL